MKMNFIKENINDFEFLSTNEFAEEVFKTMNKYFLQYEHGSPVIRKIKTGLYQDVDGEVMDAEDLFDYFIQFYNDSEWIEVIRDYGAYNKFKEIYDKGIELGYF